MPKETVVSTLSFNEGAKVLTVEISLPRQGTQQNNRKHWRAVSAAVRQARQEAETLGLQAKGRLPKHLVPLPTPVRIHHEWFMGLTKIERLCKDKGVPMKKKDKVYRPMDEGNAIGALKGPIDGLVDSGLLVGDKAGQIKWGECVLNRNEKAHKGRSCVVLTLEYKEVE